MVNKRTVFIAMLVLIFVWLIKDAFSAFQEEKEIDKNGVPAKGVITDIVHMSNRRLYAVEFILDRKLRKAWCNNNEYCKNCKIGDTINILVSSVNPSNIRCDN